VDGDESQLDGLIASLRAVDQVGVAIATEARPLVEGVARKTASAGTDPEGGAWAPTKEGRKALPNAASAVSVVVSGSTKAVLTLVLKGVYVYHQRSKNRSTTKGLPRRLILDVETVPTEIADAIKGAAKRVIARTIRGSR
jgi:hypothetical protein